MAVFDRSMAEPEGETAAAAGTERRTERRAEPAAAVPAWGPWKRIGFRWLFTYLVLYLLPTFLSLLAYIPKGDAVYNAYAKLWQVIVAWVGKVLFHLDITIFPNGSGDTTYNYVEILCFAAVAAVAALLWTLLNRRRLEYARRCSAMALRK
jgi:hypothetical protein